MKEDDLVSIARIWLQESAETVDGDSIERRLRRLIESDDPSLRDYYWSVGSLAICALAHRWMGLGGAEVNEWRRYAISQGARRDIYQEPRADASGR